LMPGAPVVLCLNAGSSSLKFSIWDDEKSLGEGEVEGIGRPEAFAWLQTPSAPARRLPGQWADHGEATASVFTLLGEHALPAPAGVGHRLVHGGRRHAAPERVTPTLIAELRALIPLAPLHLPSGLAGVEAVAARFPALPQAVCFDTAFHRDLPEIARRLPLPRALADEAGLERFGFHGLSYEYVVERLGPVGRGRVVIAHLGSGASMAAVRDGRVVDTTMGLTPAGGFMMGTRTGDLDPGVLLYLMRERGYDAQRLDRLVNKESGLLGVSGTSADMKTLLERRATDEAAALAVAMFCYQARKQIGALAAAMGGLDTLVFTGGIGERAAPVRAEICDGLAHLGVRIDARRNAAHEDPLSAPAGGCAVRVVATHEDLMIARHSRAVLFARGREETR
ncbi:MAG TPA: acetate/propionate family kinase, partial [Candidatus Eisenbacteria bacterium]|nr:acetate/propionate family kinase [Candidatus Eisenbacteria bacterium]